MTVQPDLCQTCLETTLLVFPRGGSILPYISARFSAMKACPDTYFIIVLEDTTTGEVIGSATLAVEQKFIRATKCVSYDSSKSCKSSEILTN